MMRRRSDLPPADPQPWAEMIPADSFYARLAQWRDVLVDDEDYAPLYKDSPRGRPSIPPSMVVLAMLLEYHDDCSDAEAEQRMRFDLRWKHALGLGLQEAGFDATVLCRFRRKLLECGLGAHPVRAAGERGPRRRECSPRTPPSFWTAPTSLGPPERGTPTRLSAAPSGSCCARSDTPRRAEPGFRSGSGATSTPPLPRSPRSTGVIRRLAPPISRRSSVMRGRRFRWHKARTRVPRPTKPSALLSKIVSDDVEEGPPRRPNARAARPRKRRKRPSGRRLRERNTPPRDDGPRLRRGVAKDRILSVVDPEMRCGHKSKRQAWAGYKVHIAEEPRAS